MNQQESADARWERHDREWRDPACVVSQWNEADRPDAGSLNAVVRGRWWEIIAECRVTLLVTREYEHLVLALSHIDETPAVSYMRIPHPSGLAVDLDRNVVHLASTRNPNQVYDLSPLAGVMDRADIPASKSNDRPLIPIRSRFLPGCMRLHDLAMIGGVLHANSVGQNVVVKASDTGGFQTIWWPKCIEIEDGSPVTDQNYIQLNSIAAGPTIGSSFFTASSNQIGKRRPGDKDYPVDRRGVVFSGETREPIAKGLTRPHSARFADDGHLWIDNSGYGQFGPIRDGRFEPVYKLSGWTRGLAFWNNYAFVGTSLIIPGYRQYAPGVDHDRAECGIHAIDLLSGHVIGSIIWPQGNQIFAIEAVPQHFTTGFPFMAFGTRNLSSEQSLFYAFITNDIGGR